MFGKLIILMVSNFHQTSSSSKNSQTISTIWASGYDYDVIIGEQQKGQTFCITRNCYKHHARTAEVSLVDPVFQELAVSSFTDSAALAQAQAHLLSIQSLSNRFPCFYSHSHHFRPGLHTSFSSILVANRFNQKNLPCIFLSFPSNM